MAIPKAPVKRIIQDAGAERVSAEAVDALVEFLEDYAEEISKKAVAYAKYAKRKTVKEEDIALAKEYARTLPEIKPFCETKDEYYLDTIPFIPDEYK